MTLAIRHVRRRVGDTAGFDADAATYIRAVQSADGAALEPAVARAINAFVLGCKADGIWTPIKSCCILMGARTLTGALTALVGSAPTNNNFVSGDYARKTGLTGNGSTKYLNTNRANNADPQDNFHMSVYYSGALTTGNGLIAAGGTGSGATGLIVVSPNLSVRNRSGNANAAVAASVGFIGTRRSANTGNADFRVGGATTNYNETSATPTSDNFFTHARNNGSGTATNHSNARIAFYSIGEALTLSTLDTRVSDLYTAIGNAIP